MQLWEQIFHGIPPYPINVWDKEECREMAYDMTHRGMSYEEAQAALQTVENRACDLAERTGMPYEDARRQVRRG